MAPAPALLSGTQRPSMGIGLAVSVAAVAVATAVIFPLRHFAPAVSLGVVYLLAVLLVSTYWGLWLGLGTSVLAAGAFNFFFLPPTGRFTIADSRNWVVLGAFAIVAAATSRIADLARSRAIEADARRRDADLSAGLARLLLGPRPLPEAASLAAHRIAAALQIRSAAIEFAPSAADPRRVALALRDDGRTLATLLVPANLPVLTQRRLHEHVVPALEAILRAAVEREALHAEIVATEALRHSDELKTAILRAVSHDLRTPLTAIHAAGHALADPDVRPGEREELATAIVAESSRLSALVEKLLDLSRLQAQSGALNVDQCSLEDALLAVIDNAGGDVRMAVDGQLPLIRADGAQLERAFANLVENAVRHAAGHPVHVRARVVGPRVVVRIVDRGPGIPAAEQERIFEPFYRGPGESRGEGAGLGLAIAKGFIEANGGTIHVESLPGQGATFVVTFPPAMRTSPT